MNRYVIVGSGAAGIGAAEAIRSRDKDGEIWLVSGEKAGYYSRPGLAYLLTNEIDESALYPFSTKDFRRLNLQRYHANVVKIDADKHQAVLQDGKEIGYTKLLMAVGAKAARPTISGIELEGVVTLDSIYDARRIIKKARKTRVAVVVGGGITALEIVEGLRARGVRVHFLLRHNRYWRSVLDETESRIVEHCLKREGVKIHFNTEVQEIIGKGERVVGVRVKNGKTIKCGMVAFAIGIQPRVKVASVSGITSDRGIRVNEQMETNQTDVYAAGDAAQVYDPLTGQFVVESLWGPARQQGHVAGLNMCGFREPYNRTIPYNVTRLAGITTTIIGRVGNSKDEETYSVVRGESETWHQIPDAIACQSNFEFNSIRVLVGEERLLGAVVMGNQTLSQPLQALISNNADITTIRNKLLQPDVPLSQILVDFWTTWRQQHAPKEH